jgi:hypothetical protein
MAAHRRGGDPDESTTFGFDDIGDFFVRHLSKGDTP